MMWQHQDQQPQTSPKRVVVTLSDHPRRVRDYQKHNKEREHNEIKQ